MNDAQCLALLQLLAEHDGIALHAATKRLALSLSEMQRVLTVLGADAQFDGLELAELRRDGERERIWLTARGRELVARA
jgi:hypothetical protein